MTKARESVLAGRTNERSGEKGGRRRRYEGKVPLHEKVGEGLDGERKTVLMVSN